MRNDYESACSAQPTGSNARNQNRAARCIQLQLSIPSSD